LMAALQPLKRRDKLTEALIKFLRVALDAARSRSAETRHSVAAAPRNLYLSSRGVPELALFDDLPEPEPPRLPPWPWLPPEFPPHGPLVLNFWTSDGPKTVSVSPQQSSTSKVAGCILALAVHPQNSDIV